MALKLHRCSTPWKVGPCWRVQKALDKQGIDYEVVKAGAARQARRPAASLWAEALSGDRVRERLDLS
jgi:hypothetical protein